MNEPAAIVHVVDDDEAFRRALMRLLAAAGFEVRGYGSSEEFLASRVEEQPACVILDVRMPGPSGLDLQQAMQEQGNCLPIVFLTGHGDIPMSVQAMKAGAVDFLTKPVQADDLFDAVRTALERHHQNCSRQIAASELDAIFASLTPRERSVFRSVTAGNLNKQIAVELGIAERTVKAHRAAVMSKTGAESLADLVRIADEMRRYGVMD